MTAAVLDRRLVRANRDFEILGYRQLKRFDDSGAVPIHSFTNTEFHHTPVHAYLLNGQVCDEVFNPGRLLYFNDAANTWNWAVLQGLDSTGVNTPAIQVIKRSDAVFNEQPRRYHEYSHLKLNLWGAKSKAVRYQIDVIQPKSDEVNPYHWAIDTPMNTVAAQAWEEQVKQYTFNPISKLDHYIKSNFKIIKSMSVMISPTSTTESDADPHVKTIDWFMRVNKMVQFDKTTRNGFGDYTLQDAAELKNANNFTTRVQKDTSEMPRDTQAMIVLIRATDYSEPQPFTNNLHASYDIDFRTKFTGLS